MSTIRAHTPDAMKIISDVPPTVDRPLAYVTKSCDGVIPARYSWINMADSGWKCERLAYFMNRCDDVISAMYYWINIADSGWQCEVEVYFINRCDDVISVAYSLINMAVGKEAKKWSCTDFAFTSKWVKSGFKYVTRINNLCCQKLTTKNGETI